MLLSFAVCHDPGLRDAVLIRIACGQLISSSVHCHKVCKSAIGQIKKLVGSAVPCAQSVASAK
jgi:hypothetical protein